MGWVPIMVAVFMSTIFALYDLSPERRVDMEINRGAAVGAQMASFHQSSYSKCNYPAVCAAGRIDPRDVMDSALLATGSTYNNFVSTYDGTDTLVTFYQPVSGIHTNDGLLVSYLGITYGFSVLSGFYDGVNQQVKRALVISSNDPSYTFNRLPSVIGGVQIPNGVPVIVSRY